MMLTSQHDINKAELFTRFSLNIFISVGKHIIHTQFYTINKIRTEAMVLI